MHTFPGTQPKSLTFTCHKFVQTTFYVWMGGRRGWWGGRLIADTGMFWMTNRTGGPLNYLGLCPGFVLLINKYNPLVTSSNRYSPTTWGTSEYIMLSKLLIGKEREWRIFPGSKPTYSTYVIGKNLFLSLVPNALFNSCPVGWVDFCI